MTNAGSAPPFAGSHSTSTASYSILNSRFLYNSNLSTMVTTEEGWHTLDDGSKLYTKTWKVRNAPHQLSFPATKPPEQSLTMFLAQG